jgi:hypothetical protein
MNSNYVLADAKLHSAYENSTMVHEVLTWMLLENANTKELAELAVGTTQQCLRARRERDRSAMTTVTRATRLGQLHKMLTGTCRGGLLSAQKR